MASDYERNDWRETTEGLKQKCEYGLENTTGERRGERDREGRGQGRGEERLRGAGETNKTIKEKFVSHPE